MKPISILLVVVTLLGGTTSCSESNSSVQLVPTYTATVSTVVTSVPATPTVAPRPTTTAVPTPTRAEVEVFRLNNDRTKPGTFLRIVYHKPTGFSTPTVHDYQVACDYYRQGRREVLNLGEAFEHELVSVFDSDRQGVREALIYSLSQLNVPINEAVAIVQLSWTDHDRHINHTRLDGSQLARGEYLDEVCAVINSK